MNGFKITKATVMIILGMDSFRMILCMIDAANIFETVLFAVASLSICILILDLHQGWKL